MPGWGVLMGTSRSGNSRRHGKSPSWPLADRKATLFFDNENGFAVVRIKFGRRSADRLTNEMPSQQSTFMGHRSNSRPINQKQDYLIFLISQERSVNVTDLHSHISNRP